MDADAKKRIAHALSTQPTSNSESPRAARKHVVLPEQQAEGLFIPTKKTAVKGDRRGSFFGDRRVSVAESSRRQSWLDRTRKVPQRNRGRVLHEVRFPDVLNGLYSVRFSPGGNTLVTSFGAGAIQLRSSDTGELKATLRSGMEQTFPVMCVRFHPIRTELFYAASAEGVVFMCSATAGDFSRYIEEPKNEVNTLDVNLSGELIATAGKDATVRLYDVDTVQMLKVYQKPLLDIADEVSIKYHRMRIFAARFHPQFRETLITGGWDDMVKIWDVRVTSGCVRTIRGPHICGDAIDVKENVILTGSWVVNSSLQLWDMGSAKLIDTIVPTNRPTTLDGEFLYSAHYFDGDPYGDMVVIGGSGTGAVEVISISEKRVLGSFRVHKSVHAIDSLGNVLAYGGMETVLRIGDFA